MVPELAVRGQQRHASELHLILFRAKVHGGEQKCGGDP